MNSDLVRCFNDKCLTSFDGDLIKIIQFILESVYLNPSLCNQLMLVNRFKTNIEISHLTNGTSHLSMLGTSKKNYMVTL